MKNHLKLALTFVSFGATIEKAVGNICEYYGISIDEQLTLTKQLNALCQHKRKGK